MAKTVVILLLFMLLLAPSAWFAWQNRHMPQFGQSHDDAIYYIAAKSLTDGQGYRIASLPDTPYETKYPPLLPWLLSIAWIVQPRFPENLAIATAIQWAMIPPFLWLCEAWFRRMGFSPVWRYSAVAVLAVQPYTVLFGAGIFTEILYAGILLGSLLACDQARKSADGVRWAALAGALAGVGYLARSAGVVAIISLPAVFLLWKKRREALAFFAGMVPMVAGWMSWVHLHQSPSTTLVALYNTDYLGFQLLNVHWNDLGVVVWTNLAHLLYQMGTLVFPLESDSFLMPLIRDTIGVAILWRLFCRRRDAALQPYLFFAVLTVVELLVWHFPPNLRLMYPLVPLFAAGLMWEGEHLVRMIRQAATQKDRSQRVAAWAIASVVAAAVLWGIWTQSYMTFRLLPTTSSNNHSIQTEHEEAYRWIAQHVDAKFNVLAANPALYLYTGRHTAGIGVMPIDWYRHNHTRMLATFRGISDYASANNLEYIYMHESDYYALIADAADDARRAVESGADVHLVFHGSHGAVFRVERSGAQP